MFLFVGADILFVESPETEAEMERVGEALAGVPPLRQRRRRSGGSVGLMCFSFFCRELF